MSLSDISNNPLLTFPDAEKKPFEHPRQGIGVH
jgi:hypothetical protein